MGVAIGAVGMMPVVRLLLHRGEQRARDAERRALEAQRLAELGSMTSGLAHEIKNPLSTIGLNAQLLRESAADADMPEEVRSRFVRRLEALQREVERLSGILNDFLQFAGRMRLDPQACDLARLVDELSDFFHPQCDRAGVVLRTQLPDQPVTVVIDASLTKQAILNLMINAVQAMREQAAAGVPSELMLTVERDAGEARVHVTDTGPGIPADRIESIFRPYVSHGSGGTGLGLPTARRIVQEQGGRLEVHSEPGRGSSFVVGVPVERD
jgi:signal transduction histidine kinase